MYDKLIIFYFTGTGNALAVTNWIKQVFTAKNIPVEIIKITPSLHYDISETSPKTLIGFCYPTHGFNASPVVINLLFRLRKIKRRVFLINTRAGLKMHKLFVPGLSGLAQLFPALIISLKGGKIMGYQPMDLPSNWISVHPGLKEKVVQSIFKRCEKITKRFALKMLNGQRVYKAWLSFPFDILVSPISVLYYFFGRFALSKTFIADSKCNGCGLCAKQCPVNAIKMKSNYPFWTSKCESCMHCMNHCPKRAIQTPQIIVGMLWWFMHTVFPVLILGTVINPGGLVEQNYTLFTNLVIFGLGLPYLFLSYRILHFLMRFKYFNWFVSFTSFTHFKFWRRYRAPKTNL